MNTRHLFRTSFRRTFFRAATFVAAALLASASIGPAAVSAPVPAQTDISRQSQNVDWMSADTATYLGGIGMDVMVPSWIPSPFTGVAPDVYAGGGSYSLYWMAAGSPPTFLHITGVVGAGFPDGSKADLNVPLSVNADVQGWPAVRDIGVPAGSSTPIYDQVFWIVGGVRYSVESNNIGTDSLTIANSMLFLEAPVYEEPAYEEPVVEAPVPEEPAAPPVSEPVVQEPEYEETVVEEPVHQQPAVVEEVEEPVTSSDTSSTTSSGTDTGGNTESTGSGGSTTTTTTDPGTGTSSQTVAEPWSPGKMDGSYPSDGTSGPRPPVIGGDGTGGLYDTSLPRIVRP